MANTKSESRQVKAKIKRRRWRKDDTELTLLAAPTIIWYIIFCFLPMFGVIISFKKFTITRGKGFLYSLIHSDWVGFENFRFLFASNDLYVILRNTILYNAVFIVLAVLIPVTLAIMISMIYSRTKSKVYQTMMFFPHFMSWVVVGYFVYAFLSIDKGLLNGLLKTLGKDSILWYSEGKYWPFILTVVQIWKTAGYNMVVYLASISGIDPTLYEAAVIDGASKRQQIRYITLPCLKPIMIMMFILNVGRIFYSDFGLFYQVTRLVPGSLFNWAATIDTYVFTALKASTPMGMSASVTLFQSVACCITILLANYIVRKIDSDSAII